MPKPDRPSLHQPSLPRPSAAPRWVAGTVIALGDLFIVNILVVLSVGLRALLSPLLPIDIGPHVYAGVSGAASLLPIACWLGRLYPGYGQAAVERMRKRITITLLCFGTMIVFDYLALNGQWSRGVLLLTAALSVIVLPLWDTFARCLLIRLGWWGKPVAVLGPETQRRGIINTLVRHPEIGWSPVEEGELTAPSRLAGSACTLALVALPPQSAPITALADDLPFQRVVLVPDISGTQSLWVSVRDLGTHLGLEMQRNLLIRRNQIIKRGLDLVFGCLGLALSAPLIAVAAVLVVALSPGPVFYSQIRYGRGGRSFRMWKLRTMHANAEVMLQEVIATAGPEWSRTMKLRRDPRIIRVVGHPIRRFSIDELPQFLNVIRGEMSLVGPRPLPDYHLEQLSPETNIIRSRVRPGLTGLWQVSGRSDTGLEEQQHLDIYYVRNWSLWLDLYITARTVGAVAGGRGAR